MYVILKDDLPDVVVENYYDMCQHLKNMPSVAYQYEKKEDTWVVTYRYCVIEDNEIVFNVPDHWDCPAEYKTYKFPNLCPKCHSGQFMMANYCQICSGDYDDDRCLDCGTLYGVCQCQFYD